MLTEFVSVIGAGGHAKVVLDALTAAGWPIARIRLFDSAPERTGTTVLGIPVKFLDPALGIGNGSFHVAIGNNAVRARLAGQLASAGGTPLTIVHPGATVSAFARVGPGVFIASRAVIGPDASLAEGVLVNHGAVVDHDCTVGAFCHIAPNATLAGNVVLGQRILIGAGANLLPAVRVEDDGTVGAGALVRSDVPSGQTWVGVPAQKI